MIRTSSFDKVFPVALNLQDTNKSLVAIEDTPVGRLVAPLIAPNLFRVNDGNTYSIADIVGILQTTGQVDGVDPYDYNLKQFVDLAVKGVQSTIHLTKNIAIPVINDVANKCEEAVADKTVNRGFALNIIDDGAKSILDSVILQNAVDRYTDIALDKSIGTVPYHEARSTEQIMELMKVGLEKFDKEVEEWLAKACGSENVIDLYFKVFSQGNYSSALVNVIGKDTNSYINAIIVFLIGLGLSKDLDPNIPLSKSEYELQMSNVICFAGMVVKQAISRRKSNSITKYLVDSFPPANEEFSYTETNKGIIVVNKSLYDQYLEAGGTPEAIMGAYLSDRENQYDRLLEKVSDYTRVYNARLLQARSNNTDQATLTLRRTMRSCLYAEIDHCRAEATDKGLWTGINLDTQKAYELVDKLTGKITVLDLNNIYLAAKDIVLTVFFQATDVKEMLDYIDNAQTLSENDDMQTAVNIAIIDYVVNWFFSQTKVV